MSISAEEAKIKFPNQHYVGFQKRSKDELLGFMTPEGTDSAAKKRKATVDSWAKNNLRTYNWQTKEYTDHDPIPSVVYDNAPLEGFILRESVNHSSSWNNSRDKWRVLDPRGFELEINSGNLEKIMNTCTIEKGLIKDPCIWARYGAINILVPVSHPLYAAATKNTEVANKTASTRDISIGDRVTLQDGQVGTYLGYYYNITQQPYTRDYGSDEYFDRYSLEVGKNKRHWFLKDEGSFFYYASVKVSSFVKGSPITNPVTFINKALNIDAKTESGSETVYGVTTQKNVNLTLKLVSAAQLGSKHFNEGKYSSYRRHQWIASNTIEHGNVLALYSGYNYPNTCDFSIYTMDLKPILKNAPPSYYWGRRNKVNVQISIPNHVLVDKVVAYYAFDEEGSEQKIIA